MKQRTLLVVECQSRLNWYKIFEGATLANGSAIRVEQAEWDDILPISYHDTGVLCTIRAQKTPHPDTNMGQDRTVVVDFVLLRSVTRGVKGQDSRNKLWAFMHGNLPAVNSLMSAYICLEKPTVFGALKGIQKKLGRDAFPLIDQNFYVNHKNMLMTPSYPFVAKIGGCHAGYGKMRIETSTQYQDFCSIVALHQDYVTLEEFIDWDFDMRIQKIGPNYRCFRYGHDINSSSPRRMSPNWKGNVGNMSILEDKYKTMIDECAKLWGGLDICALDLVHCKEDDREYILELNDTAIGLVHKYAEEDMSHMRDIVVSKMNAHFCGSPVAATDSTEDTKELQTQIAALRTQLEREQKTLRTLQSEITVLREAEEEKSSPALYLAATGVAALLAIGIYFYNSNDSKPC